MKRMGIADLVNLINDDVSSRSQGLTSNAACEDHRVPLYLTGPNQRCNSSHGCSTRMETNKKYRRRRRIVLKFLRKLLNSKSVPKLERRVLKARRLGFQMITCCMTLNQSLNFPESKFLIGQMRLIIIHALCQLFIVGNLSRSRVSFLRAVDYVAHSCFALRTSLK